MRGKIIYPAKTFSPNQYTLPRFTTCFSFFFFQSHTQNTITFYNRILKNSVIVGVSWASSWELVHSFFFAVVAWTQIYVKLFRKRQRWSKVSGFFFPLYPYISSSPDLHLTVKIPRVKEQSHCKFIMVTDWCEQNTPRPSSSSYFDVHWPFLANLSLRDMIRKPDLCALSSSIWYARHFKPEGSGL